MYGAQSTSEHRIPQKTPIRYRITYCGSEHHHMHHHDYCYEVGWELLPEPQQFPGGQVLCSTRALQNMMFQASAGLAKTIVFDLCVAFFIV